MLEIYFCINDINDSNIILWLIIYKNKSPFQREYKCECFK